MSNPSLPRVSIGMPVRNSKPKLFAEALRGILTQTERDFELLLSDNASDEGAAEMFRRAAVTDSRIRLVRHAELVSVTENFVGTLKAARAPYFMWAADDDVREPEYLAKVLPLLDGDPAAIAAHSGTVLIDPEGIELGRLSPGQEFGDPSAWRRLDALRDPMFYMDYYAVFRREPLMQTVACDLARLNTWGGDGLLILEVLLRGPLLRCPEPLFRYRRRADSSQISLAQWLIKNQIDSNDPRSQWEEQRSQELLRSVREAPLDSTTRAACWTKLWLILHTMPFTIERQHLWRHRFSEARSKRDLLGAAHAALSYAALAPSSVLRRTAWQRALGGRS